MKINKFSIISIIIPIIISYYYFWISGYHYFFDDVYAYLSYSQSLSQDGVLRDLTTFPSTAPITIQNGIVLIYSLVRFFTQDMILMVHIVSFILVLNLLLVFFLIYKIGQLLNINSKQLYILIIALSLGYYFYGYYVTPTNDGFYASLSLLAVYFTLKLFEQDRVNYKWYLFLIILVLPLFRLQGLVVYIAGLLVFLLILKQYKNSLYYVIYLVIGYLIVLLSIYSLIDDLSGLEMIAKVSIIYHFNLTTIIESLSEILINTIPSIFLNFPASRFEFSLIVYIKIIFSSILIFILSILFIISLRKKNYKIIFILLIILGNFLALILFNVIIDRYLYFNVPLILLVVLSFFEDRKRSYLIYFILILNIFTITLRLYLKDYDNINIKNNVEYIKNNIKDYSLISEMPRQTYFYLNQASYSNKNQIQINSGNLLIIGREQFIKDTISQLNLHYDLREIQDLSLRWQNANLTYMTFKVDLKNKFHSKETIK